MAGLLLNPVAQAPDRWSLYLESVSACVARLLKRRDCLCWNEAVKASAVSLGLTAGTLGLLQADTVCILLQRSTGHE